MRTFVAIAGIGLLLAAGGTTSAVAYPIKVNSLGRYDVSDCATGFTKTRVTGSKDSDHSYTCVLSNVYCPPSTVGRVTLSGPISSPQATVTGSGGQFSYLCSYFEAPH